jgi:hypothetical protein
MGVKLRKVCSEYSGDPRQKKCFALGDLWSNRMCYRHATQSGCRPPLERHICKVCAQITEHEEDFAKRTGFCLVLTRARQALGGAWAGGRCWRHAKLAGRSRNDKMFDDDKKTHVLPGQTQLPWAKDVATLATLATDVDVARNLEGTVAPKRMPSAKLKSSKVSLLQPVGGPRNVPRELGNTNARPKGIAKGDKKSKAKMTIAKK